VTIASISEVDKDLAVKILDMEAPQLAKTLGTHQANLYEEFDIFAKVVRELAPEKFEYILGLVEADQVEKHWATCMRGPAPQRRTMATLIEAAIRHGGELGSIAAKLRARFPKASVPPLTHVRARRRGRRRRRSADRVTT
jgi:hypothetical protein